jgi:hypothetical protein
LEESKRCPEIETSFVATDKTENNRGTATHGEFYPDRVEVIKGSGLINLSSRDQSEIQAAVRYLFIQINQTDVVEKDFNV